MNSLSKILSAVLCCAVVVAGCGGSSELDDSSQVRASVTAVYPTDLTDKVVLVWHFEVADGWHLYSPGRNDSGYPPTVELVLPSGWKAGELQWPAPERHLGEGDILDHVYYEGLVLLQEIAVPVDFEPNDGFEIQAEVSWLACKGMCVPGDTEVVVKQLAGSQADYERARSDLPLPWPGEILEAQWHGATLHITGPENAVLTFMPDNDCGRLENLIDDGVGAGLKLQFRPKEGLIGPARGLITMDNPGEPRRSFNADIPAISWQSETSGD